MSAKKRYVPPKLARHNSDSGFTGRQRNLIRSMRLEAESSPHSEPVVGPECVTLIDLDRRYVQVSEEFCTLVGYDREALIGKRYDDLTAPGTNDIRMVFNLFCQLQYMHGLWLLLTRSGSRILGRYESWLRPDRLIEAHMQVVGVEY